MQAIEFVPGRKNIPRIQEMGEMAGSSENAIQPVIGYGGGECSDKIILQVIQVGIRTAGWWLFRGGAHTQKRTSRVIRVWLLFTASALFSEEKSRSDEEKSRRRVERKCTGLSNDYCVC